MFAFESHFAYIIDPIGKKTGGTQSSAGAFTFAFRVCASAFARETARENVFTVHLIADCFHFSGSSLKPELGS